MPDDGAKGLRELTDTLRKVSTAVPARMPRPGEVFAGRYMIERLLGRGGMGVVYLATQRPLGRLVAVKVLRPPESLEDDPKFDDRFLREAAAAARLQHPNTITVHDFGQDDEGALYLVMEYLEGHDVRTVLAHDGVFPPARAIHVAKQVCKSLREAHRKGIIHRDLKPANVLLVHRDDDVDFVKVLDFGLVKFRGEASEITLAGKFLGSPRYTSPEALDRTREVDHRADIYALGILLYAMITGAPPFDGDPMQVLHAHLHEIPQPMYRANPAAPTTPPLEALVARCLKKEPEERYQSMGDLLTALREVGAAFGQEDTETIDLDVQDSLELDGESGEWKAEEPATPRRPRTIDDSVKPRPPARLKNPPPTPPPVEAPAAPTRTPGTTEGKERPARRRKRRQAALPWVLLGSLLLVALAVGVVSLLPDGEVAPEPPSALVAAAPADIVVAGQRLLDLDIDSTPQGAAVELGFAGRWSAVGVTPLRLPEFLAPDGEGAPSVRLSLVGHEAVETATEIADGRVVVRATLSPTPTVPAESAPRPVAANKPPTEGPPDSGKPAEPTPRADEPKDAVPTGYKDNPY